MEITIAFLSFFLGYTFDFAPSNNRKEDASRTKLNRILSQKLQTAADAYEKQLKTKKSWCASIDQRNKALIHQESILTIF